MDYTRASLIALAAADRAAAVPQLRDHVKSIRWYGGGMAGQYGCGGVGAARNWPPSISRKRRTAFVIPSRRLPTSFTRPPIRFARSPGFNFSPAGAPRAPTIGR